MARARSTGYRRMRFPTRLDKSRRQLLFPLTSRKVSVIYVVENKTWNRLRDANDVFIAGPTARDK